MKYTGIFSAHLCVSLTVFTAAFLLTASAAQRELSYLERMDAAAQILTQVNSGAYADRLASVAEDVGMVKTALARLFLPEMQSAILQSLQDLSDGSSAEGETNMLRDSVGEVGNDPELSQNTTSDLCLNHTAAIFVGLLNKRGWAVQMLDAMGKPTPGITEGNFIWPGAYKLCLKVQANTSVAAQPYFSGQYCTASIQMGSDPQLSMMPLQISIGVCVPDTCSSMDLSLLLTDALVKLNVSHESAQVVCNEVDRPLDTKAIVAIVICSIFIFLIVVGTSIDIICVQRPKWKLAEQLFSPVNGYSNLEENTPLLPKTGTDMPPPAPGTCTKLIVAFSVYTNGAKLLSTNKVPGSLDCVHGVRFLSMTWVVLGHAWTTPVYMGSNVAPYAQEALHRWTFQAIANASVSVDSFFVLSGLLVAYLSLKEMKKKSGKINWFLFYFHRFWRLTPVYMLVIMVYVCLSRYWLEGPFTTINLVADRDNCAWWTNLLYINNIVKSSEMCLGQSWYLANDMQFYILSPLIFVPFYFSPLFGAISSFVFLLVTSIVPGVLTMQYHVSPGLLPGMVEGNTTADDQTFMQQFYIRPYNRMGPYVLGLMAGYFLYVKDCKLQINKFVNLLLWAVAAACALAVLYGLYDAINGHPVTLPVSAFYNAVNRQVWSAALCWVIIACVTGNGGFVNTILSWRALVPLSRLTYCIYLVHIMMIETSIQNRNTPFYIDDINLVMFFLGILVVSYMAAAVTSLAFEAPMMALEKVIFHPSSPKTNKDSRVENKAADKPHVFT